VSHNPPSPTEFQGAARQLNWEAVNRLVSHSNILARHGCAPLHAFSHFNPDTDELEWDVLNYPLPGLYLHASVRRELLMEAMESDCTEQVLIAQTFVKGRLDWMSGYYTEEEKS